MGRNGGFIGTILGTAVIAVIIIAVAYLFIHNATTRSKPITSAPQTTSSTSNIVAIQSSVRPLHPFVSTNATSSTTPTEIAGWKTYRNDAFGFRISYPSELFLSTSTFDIGTINYSNVNVEEKFIASSIGISPGGCDPRSWQTLSSSSIVVNGIPMIRYAETNSSTNSSFEMYTFKGDQSHGWNADCNYIVIHINADPDPSYGIPQELWSAATYHQILNTFQFLN